MSSLEDICDRLVPGSSAVGAADYLAERGVSPQDLSPGTPEFDRVRSLVIEAYYGDYAAAGSSGPTGHDAIGFHPPQAVRLRKTWDFASSEPSEPLGDAEAEVVIVGSGAGGGVIAAELGAAGYDVLVLEAGHLRTAADHTRFEVRANHRLWWPPRFVRVEGDRPLALLSGRCVGGSTVINTKVAMRAAPFDVAAFHTTTGLVGTSGRPYTLGDLEPYYDRIERTLGVRTRADWPASVHTVRRGFQALGSDLAPVESYTDYNCTRCGSCLQGCPTNAGKNALNTWIAPALARGEIRLATGVQVSSVLVSGGRVYGVAHEGGMVRAPVVVLAGGALNTPQILQSSAGVPGFPGTLGLHPARLVYGLFPAEQDCHMVYPITAHCLDFQRDFVIEATTIQDPVAFAGSLPFWGVDLERVMRDYRRWAGMLVMSNDLNTASVAPGDVFTKHFSPVERRRLDASLAFAVDVLRAAGATRVIWTGLCTSHVQGSAPMGVPGQSVVNTDGQSHEIQGLFVGDASLIPSSLSVNPSVTVMALALRVAEGIQRSTQGEVAAR